MYLTLGSRSSVKAHFVANFILNKEKYRERGRIYLAHESKRLPLKHQLKKSRSCHFHFLDELLALQGVRKESTPYN